MTAGTCSRRYPVLFLKGGETKLSKGGAQGAQRVVEENGFALRSPRNRSWLKSIIADPVRSMIFDSCSGNAFAAKAREEIPTIGGEDTPVSRRAALALYRLYKVKESPAFQNAMRMYDEQQ